MVLHGSGFCLGSFFLILNALLVNQVHVVGLTAILELVDAAAQDAALTLAIVLENLIVEELYESANSRLLLFGDLLPIEHRAARCLAAAHAVKPVFEFALDLPE